MRRTLLRITRYAATLVVGLYAGGVFFFSLAPSVGRLPATSYLPYWQALNADYGRAMPPLLLLGIALLVVNSALLYPRDRRAFGLTVAATVMVAATIALSVSQLDPLNQLANGWSVDQLPDDWEDVRTHWWALHTMRTVLAVLGFATLLAAGDLDQRPDDSSVLRGTRGESRANQEPDLTGRVDPQPIR